MNIFKIFQEYNPLILFNLLLFTSPSYITTFHNDRISFLCPCRWKKYQFIFFCRFPTEIKMKNNLIHWWKKKVESSFDVQIINICNLKRVMRWWRKTDNATLASSWPGHFLGPPPNGMKFIGSDVFCLQYFIKQNNCLWLFYLLQMQIHVARG